MAGGAARHELSGSLVIIFLDTEFTDLVNEPRLLSIAMVGAGGVDREFYAEVTDRQRIHAASWFALDVVLPQFGRVAHAACSYATLGARLNVFIARLVASLEPGERIDVAFSDDLDWQLAKRAMREGGAGQPALAEHVLHPRNVYAIAGFGAGKRASDAYFAAQSDAPIARHHCLCDARALRIAYQAAMDQHDARAPARGQVAAHTLPFKLR